MLNIVQNGNNKYVVFALDAESEIDTVSVEMINHTRKGKGVFAPIRLESLNGVYTEIRYDVTGKIPLRDYIERNQSQEAFRNSLLGVVNALENVGEYLIDISQVLLDLDSVFINSMDYSVALLCVPIVGKYSQNSVYSFVRSIVTSSHVNVGKNEYSYFNSVWNVTADETGFSLDNVKIALNPDQINGVSGGKGVAQVGVGVETVDQNRIRAIVHPAPQQSTTVEPQDSGKKKGILDKFFDKGNRKNGGGLAGLKNAGVARNTQVSVDQESVIGSGTVSGAVNVPGAGVSGCGIGTVPQQQNQYVPTPIKWPTLTRVSNGEIISVNKNLFVIGRAPQKDGYCTGEENRHIGRTHAIIVVNPEGCTVVDQGSANHTFVNGQLLDKGASANLVDGSVIRLANEDFVFHV